MSAGPPPRDAGRRGGAYSPGPGHPAGSGWRSSRALLPRAPSWTDAARAAAGFSAGSPLLPRGRERLFPAAPSGWTARRGRDLRCCSAWPGSTCCWLSAGGRRPGSARPSGRAGITAANWSSGCSGDSPAAWRAVRGLAPPPTRCPGADQLSALPSLSQPPGGAHRLFCCDRGGLPDETRRAGRRARATLPAHRHPDAVHPPSAPRRRASDPAMLLSPRRWPRPRPSSDDSEAVLDPARWPRPCALRVTNPAPPTDSARPARRPGSRPSPTS